MPEGVFLSDFYNIKRKSVLILRTNPGVFAEIKNTARLRGAFFVRSQWISGPLSVPLRIH